MSTGTAGPPGTDATQATCESELVVLAHEDPLTRAALSRAVADAGIAVVSAASVVEVLRLPELAQAGVLVASGGVGGGGGFDLARRVKARQSALHVHMLARARARSSAEAAVRAGQIDSYSMDPASPESLVGHVRQALALRALTGRATSRPDAALAPESTAAYDPLTGLPNRALVDERVGEAVALCEREHASLALLFLDLDGFKTVNDFLGHHVGDAILRTVGRRLSSVRRQGDTVGRYGGDEFVVVCPGVSSVDAAGELAERLLAAIRRVVDVDGIEHRLSASIGLTVMCPSEDDLASPEELLRRADLAMYQAKAQGSGRWVAFEPVMAFEARARIEMRQALRDAVRRDELLLMYQPVVDLQSGRVTGAEALLRWCHPSGGTIEPASFFAVAEESGLTVTIGEWVLEQALTDLARWRRRRIFDEDFRLWVNVWPHQLTHVRFVATLHRLLETYGVPAKSVGFDITAEAIPYLAGMPNAVADVVAMGVAVNLDDFGSRHTTFGSLDDLAFTGIKLAPELVGLLDDPTERYGVGMVRALIGLGRDLEVTLFGEGVETAAQAQTLREMGCQMAQGYHFARPAPRERMLEALSA